MDFDFTLPGLGRPESSRPKKVAEAIRNELSILLLQKVSDPRLEGVAISHVVMAPDLKRAKIYFTVSTGTDHRVVKKALLKAKGFFRSALAGAINLRYTPDLVFFYDDQSDEAQRIDSLLREIEQDRKDEGS